MEFNITLEQFQNAVEIMPMEDSGDLVINATIGSTEGGGDVTYLSQLIQDPLHRTVTDSEKSLWSGKADAGDIPTALSDLISDEAHRTVTDAEKNVWNSKSNFSGSYADLTDVPSSFIPAPHDHNTNYYLKNEVDTFLGQKAGILDVPTNLSQLSEDPAHRIVTDAEKETWNNKSDFSGAYNDLSGKPLEFPPSAHVHDDIYYQKSAVNTLLSQKADTSQIPTSLSQLTQDANNRTVTDVEKGSWNAKSEFSGGYNDLTGIPQTFTPSAHIHSVSDVTNLQEGLDSKEGVLLSSQKLRIMLSAQDPTGTDWDIWIKHEV